MKIEIDKEDFVKLAVYASCADLPEEENKCGVTLRKVMDSLDKDVANDVAGDMVALRARIEMLNGANVEDLVKTILEAMTGDEEELDLDENDGDVLKRIMKEDDE
ncbi:hypothetical protein ACTQ2W_04430 [Ligilactobacillus ruminis]|uniref:hypothetical protein n=1 Tax=Ligilactobacillus ruminis TaxID=1623 RepID=UPI003F9A2928